MKRKIICCLFLSFIVINFLDVFATKGKKKNSSLPSQHSPVAKDQVTKKNKSKHCARVLSVPTYNEILKKALKDVILEKEPPKAPAKKSTAKISELLGVPLPKEYTPEKVFDLIEAEKEKGLKTRNKYGHDAYCSFYKFMCKWNLFQGYFERLVRITDPVKYFSPESSILTQNINETIREFMTSSEYLNKIEADFLIGQTFSSQTVSEIISKKLSELGFENYIVQFIPGNTDHIGMPTHYNQSRWVVLYRDYSNGWCIVDFSLAMKLKSDNSAPIKMASMVPFPKYIGPLITIANTKSTEWYTSEGKQELHNTVMINFTPGFYELSDDYYMSDIDCVPFDYFVSWKLEIERISGIDQYVGEIKNWIDQIRKARNYKTITISPEDTQKMYEYMKNYLVTAK